MMIILMSTKNSLYKKSIIYIYDKIAATPYHNISQVTTNFKPVLSANHTKDPTPDLIACLPVLLFINSPTIAPTNGPSIIHKGPRKSHMISPIVAHRVPALLPPNFLVHHIGMI
jgi:hypothetical protein